MLQAYHSELQDYYKQNFFGLIHVLPIADGQSFKTDLRYFDSSSDGKNGTTGYLFNNNGGFAKIRVKSTTPPGARCSPTPWVATPSWLAISVSVTMAVLFT
jgi:hypothetical protein